MPHDLPKAYEPGAIEPRWAEYWINEKLFHVDTSSSQGAGETFTITLPPPNVTGNLHMGHMLEHTEIDIIVRWKRMSGLPTLWLPGTDHAGIATQLMVERQLASEGKNRRDMGREAFIQRVWDWKQHYGGVILQQMKRLGASVDWSREYFTMDERMSRAVREAFVRLYEEGLIYRGKYIVNWCPRCITAVSDLEVVHEETQGKLYEIRYPVVGLPGEYIIVATTRPETMLGDTAIAVNSGDERYKHLHGKRVLLPLMNREIPIVTDDILANPEFGTGAVKVTPSHDPNDFEAGLRNNLPQIDVMNEIAQMNENAGPYKGLDRFEARSKVLEDLEAGGFLVGSKDYVVPLGKCDRCKTITEPRLSTQWFVKIQPLADRAIEVVENGDIKFVPEMYTKTYFEWMRNIHDWCISRQLWWGHRIPAWHCAVCHKMTVGREDPAECVHCGSEKIEQSTDVLDTWFSSGLLPVSVFGWPNITAENRADFDAFYPTSLLITGFDILFFWVARMIMLGCWFSDDVKMPDGSARSLADSVPFREVYIHALVRDANREKMSKTKGNVVDPIEIVKQYGTDAVRFTLASMASPGTDIAFNIARTEGYRAFANKIWNAARFLFMNVDRAAEIGIGVDPATLGGMPVAEPGAPLETRWIVAELHAAAAKVNEALANYRFDDAANTIYQFFWGSFCDWYLEIVKLSLDIGEDADKTRTKAALSTLVGVFETSLRLLSPFMPFLTEEIWHAVYDGNPPAKSIALTRFPKAHGSAIDNIALNEMALLQELIVEVRALRKEIGVEEKAVVPIEVRIDGELKPVISENLAIVERLARVSDVRFVEQMSVGLAKLSTPQFDVAVVYERKIDVAAEREKLSKEIARLEKVIANSDRQLGNPGFTAKAPGHIVEGLKKQRDEAQQLLGKLRRDLDSLPPA
jgi:valyl-tRNA synthetase